MGVIDSRLRSAWTRSWSLEWFSERKDSERSWLALSHSTTDFGHSYSWCRTLLACQQSG